MSYLGILSSCIKKKSLLTPAEIRRLGSSFSALSPGKGAPPRVCKMQMCCCFTSHWVTARMKWENMDVVFITQHFLCLYREEIESKANKVANGWWLGALKKWETGSANIHPWGSHCSRQRQGLPVSAVWSLNIYTHPPEWQAVSLTSQVSLVSACTEETLS